MLMATCHWWQKRWGRAFLADIHLMQLSLAHYGECNGDLMADPEMMFFFNKQMRKFIKTELE